MYLRIRQPSLKLPHGKVRQVTISSYWVYLEYALFCKYFTNEKSTVIIKTIYTPLPYTRLKKTHYEHLKSRFFTNKCVYFISPAIFNSVSPNKYCCLFIIIIGCLYSTEFE